MTYRPEEIEHINLVIWFEHHYPELAPDLHHFANERRCSVLEGRKLKRMGVKRGVFDLFLAFPHLHYHGLWLELKVNKNTLSPEQKEFMTQKTKRGYFCAAAWGFEQGKEMFLHYLKDYKSN